MKCVLSFLLLVLVKCARTDSTTTETCKSSSAGTHFLFGNIGWGISLTSNFKLNLHIMTAMQVPAHVRVISPSINMNKTYAVSNYTTVPLDGTLIQYENGTQFKGIELISDINVSVTVFTGNTDLAEGYLALPVTALGTRYIAASYHPIGSHSSEILVAGIQNDTNVTLNTVIDGHVGSKKTFRLQKFETYQLKSKFDISGTVITSNKPVSPPMDEYITLFVNVSYNSYYQLHHSGGKKFGAVIYGRPHTNVAYGNPLQLSFTDIECENITASLKTSPAHAQTTSLDHALTTSPAHAQTTTVSAHFNQTDKNDGTWCFQCDGMTHLQYCDQVKRCQTNDEVCYVQNYHSSTGVSQFRSGCIRPEQCNNHNGNNGCMECCHGNFCNTAGCGEKGMPAPGQRGHNCFECTHIGEDEDCKTVQLCHSNQACMVAKFEWGDNTFYYDMQCTDTQVCSTKRSSSGLNKRHVPVCTHCCHSDFCNMNCTSSYSVPSIVG